MWSRDYRDILIGAVFVLLGLATTVYAATHYKLGSFARIGPGMFPVGIGLVLAALGAAIAAPAWRRAGAIPGADVRPAVAVLAAVAAFAAAAEPLGLVPASFLLTFVAVLADGRPRPLRALVLAAVLSFFAWAIFLRGLGVQLETVRLPF